MSGLAVALQESARAQPLTQKSGCIFPFPSQETLHQFVRVDAHRATVVHMYIRDLLLYPLRFFYISVYCTYYCIQSCVGNVFLGIPVIVVDSC